MKRKPKKPCIFCSKLFHPKGLPSHQAKCGRKQAERAVETTNRLAFEPTIPSVRGYYKAHRIYF